jgi:hypothetical protein
MSRIARPGESKFCFNPEIIMGSVAPQIWTSVDGHVGNPEKGETGKGTYDQQIFNPIMIM